MGMALAAAAAICAASLATGLTARFRIGRHAWPADWPAQASRPAGWRSMAVAVLRPDWAVAALTVLLLIIDAILALAAPWPLQLVVDSGLGHRPFPSWLAGLGHLPAVALASAAAAAGLALLAAAAIAGYLTTFLGGLLSERMTLRLRGGLFRHVLQASPGAVDRYPLGELTSRIGPDVRQVSDTIGTVLQVLIPDVTLLIGMIAVTAWLDWRLTLIVACVLPGYAVTARLRNRALRSAQQEARARSGDLAALSADQLSRLPAVHVFGQQAAELARHARAAGKTAEAAVAALDASARYRPVNDILPGLALAAALVAGTVEVSAGRLTIGGLLVFVAYLSSLTGPVHSLATLSTAVARGSASRDRVSELLALPTPQPAADLVPLAGRHRAGRLRPLPLHPGHPAGAHVRLDDVTFGHPGGPPVLRGVSFGLAPGSITCLTGPSGAGKSSLLALLVRLADPRSGRILIDGKDIAGLPLERLRGLVALVPQDPWLHTGTIAENIGYGRAGASRAQIQLVAARAGVTGFAAGLPGGLDAPVGEHGSRLSGGQRRRVAVARALLRETPLLLLDEPTAGLDPATEERLIAGLLDATRGTTVLLVTHQPRLAGIAGQHLRLEGGKARATSERADGGAPIVREIMPNYAQRPAGVC
ncbi:MAG TPA: ABC transporter ATP-binding protein [Streptosporangiaceae bacterium]